MRRIAKVERVKGKAEVSSQTNPFSFASCNQDDRRVEEGFCSLGIPVFERMRGLTVLSSGWEGSLTPDPLASLGFTLLEVPIRGYTNLYEKT